MSSTSWCVCDYRVEEVYGKLNDKGESNAELSKVDSISKRHLINLGSGLIMMFIQEPKRQHCSTSKRVRRKQYQDNPYAKSSSTSCIKYSLTALIVSVYLDIKDDSRTRWRDKLPYSMDFETRRHYVLRALVYYRSRQNNRD